MRFFALGYVMENHITNKGERRDFAGKRNRYHNCSVSKGHKAPETPLCCIIEIEEVNIKIHGTKNEYQAITPEDVLTGSGMVYS